MPITVDRAEVQRLQAAGATLVEVLPAEEYELQHIAGAINLPLRELDRAAAERLPRGRPTVVYCNDVR